MSPSKAAGRLHKALDSLHKIETHKLNVILQQLETERHQMLELASFIQSQQESISTFSDLNMRSLSSAKRRVHQLEEAFNQQKLVVAQAGLGSDKAKHRLRQATRQEDEKRLDRNNEEHLTRLSSNQSASLR